MRIWDKITHYPKISLVILAYVAFIALGMPDGLLGVAWPSIRASFSIPLDAVGLLIDGSRHRLPDFQFFKWSPDFTVGRRQRAGGQLCPDRCWADWLYPRPGLVDDGPAGYPGWFGSRRD